MCERGVAFAFEALIWLCVVVVLYEWFWRK